MSMIIKSYTVSNRVNSTKEVDGRVTDRTVWSEPGIRAELMLLPEGQWKVRGRPDRIHVSLSIDIDHVPVEAVQDMDNWLRKQLISMLQEDEEKGGTAE